MKKTVPLRIRTTSPVFIQLLAGIIVTPHSIRITGHSLHRLLHAKLITSKFCNKKSTPTNTRITPQKIFLNFMIILFRWFN